MERQTAQTAMIGQAIKGVGSVAITNTRLSKDTTPEERYALQRLAREATKAHLLADLKADMVVCQIEGWNHLEYLNELLELISSLKSK